MLIYKNFLVSFDKDGNAVGIIIDIKGEEQKLRDFKKKYSPEYGYTIIPVEYHANTRMSMFINTNY